MRWRWVVWAVLGCVLASGCTSPSSAPAPTSTPTPAPVSSSAPAATTPSPSSPSPSSPSPTRTSAAPRPVRTEQADPRWRFFSADHRPHTSPWFAGRHRVMIGYGCTVAPYYSHDPLCPGRQGFHHGVDVAMPCGTRLFAGRAGTVVDPVSSGAPGPAYGGYAFRIRSGGVDVLIGHVRKVYVDPGDAVRRGQLVARANDEAAPDGCHLHFEVRRAGGGLSTAVDPAPYLQLSGLSRGS